ncbi:MAG: DUF86 domain-containing protein [Cyanothece sp. SIO2G6]|nr:DUF86 domain-containing protein [Cyanothece sp. SIO2G6]
MRSDQERLHDILEAIAQIEQYAVRGKAAFEQDELIQVWMVHHLQIIGEAASATSDELQQQYTNVPWAEIIAFRNVLVHEYFRINRPVRKLR